MSRKATERRFNPDAFVEANLWVVTRPEVQASFRGRTRGGHRERRRRRARGRAGRASPPRSQPPPRTRRAPPNTRETRRGTPGRGARCRGRGDGALRGHRVRRGVRPRLGRSRGDMRAELASPYPGQVAKSTARLLKKLNVSDALLAASGADVAVLLKVLSSAAENTKAVVLPSPTPPRSLPCSPASAPPPATAPREGSRGTSASGTCRRNTATRVFRTTSARPCGASWPRRSRTPTRRTRRRMNAKKRLFLSRRRKAWNKGLLVERKKTRANGSPPRWRRRRARWSRATACLPPPRGSRRRTRPCSTRT